MLSMLATNWAALGILVACGLAVSLAVVAYRYAQRWEISEARALFAVAAAREAGQRLAALEAERARIEAERVRLESRVERMSSQVKALRAMLARAGVLEEDGAEPTELVEMGAARAAAGLGGAASAGQEHDGPGRK